MLIRISGPAEEPVTLAEVKAHVAAIGTADDALLSRLLGSAVQAFDGPDGRLGRCLVSQRWRYELTAFPAGPLRLPMPPIISVETVGYVDGNGDAQDFTEYSVSGLGSTDNAFLIPSSRWPNGTAVSVEFTAGFGDADDVPEDIKTAILSATASSYAWREGSVLAQGTLNSNPEIADTIDRWRVRGFG